MGQLRLKTLAKVRARSSVSSAVLCLGLVAAVSGSGIAAISDAPKFIPPVSKQPPAGTRVNVVASKLTYDGRSKIAVATGSVQLVYGPYTLTATKVVYDMNKNTLTANGSVEVREPNGNILQASMAVINDKFKEGFARHVRALLTNDVTITADYARRQEGGITVFEHVSYTACKTAKDSLGDPLWQILARQATHDANTKTITYRDAKLVIGGLPVFWTPYLSYPDPSVKRRSGFLIPNFSYGKAYGFGVTEPYFWVVAPNADVTFKPRLTSKQGVLGDVEWRHRLASGTYNIHGYGIYQLDPKQASDGSSWRGALQSKGDFRLNDVWTWGWDGTAASDHTFLNDYDIDNSTLITSSAHITGLADRNYASAQAFYYQTTLDQSDLIDTQREQYGQDKLPYALPYVNLSYYFDQPVLGGELGFDMNAYSLRRDKALEIVKDDFGLGTEQSRAVANLHWQRQFINGPGQVITPFAQLRSDLYLSNNVPGASTTDDTSAHVLPLAGVDVRWPFISSGSLGQSIMTPVFQVMSSPNEQDENNIGNEDAVTLNFDHSNLFLADRFTGFDRYEGGTRANAGVVYNLLGDNGAFLRASFGESFHIAGTNSFTAGSGLDGPRSDLVGAVAFQPSDNLRLTYEARMEEDLSRVNVQEAGASLTLDRISGSLSYADIASAAAYGRDSREQQVWGDASYKLDEAWSLFGGFRYDIEGSGFMNKNIGIAFDCDCLSARLTYAENKDLENQTDHSLKLSVELRTLGRVDGGFRF